MGTTANRKWYDVKSLPRIVKQYFLGKNWQKSKNYARYVYMRVLFYMSIVLIIISHADEQQKRSELRRHKLPELLMKDTGLDDCQESGTDQRIRG